MSSENLEIRITGLREVQRALLQFSPRLATRVNQVALKKGANWLKAKIQAAAPVKTGRLRQAMRVKNSKINTIRRNGVVGVYFTSNAGKKRSDPKGAWYTKWQESGWNTGGRATGRQSISAALHGGRSGSIRRDYRMRTHTMNRPSGGVSRYGYRARGGGRFVEGKHFIERTFNANAESALQTCVFACEQATSQIARNLNFNISGGR